MFITKTKLSRRAVLQGVGAALGLPLLEAMVPALTPVVRTAANPVPVTMPILAHVYWTAVIIGKDTSAVHSVA